MEHLIQLLQRAKEKRLCLTSLILLMHVKLGRPSRPIDLTHACGVTSAAITGILDRLEKLKLVERKDAPHDRRAFKVVLTQDGEDVLKHITEST